MALREIGLRVISSGHIARGLGALRLQRGTIFYLHRFASAAGAPHGHDLANLRHALVALRAAKVQLVSLEAMYGLLRAGEPLIRPLVAFTVDDGYRDFVDIGVPLFSEFDCPATCFVVPGVIDGDAWFWWDQIDWIQRNSVLPAIDFELKGQSRRLGTGASASSQRDTAALIDQLKSVSTRELRETIATMATKAEVDLSGAPPAEYAVASWNDLRRVEKRGFSIGAHTMTHPILSQCTDEQSRREIVESVARVTKEMVTPSRFFCYPNGGQRDFGVREMETVRSTGLDGAVSTEAAHIPVRDVAHISPWSLPRFSHEERIGACARVVLIP